MFHGDHVFAQPDWEPLLREHGLFSTAAFHACRDGVVVRQGTGSEVLRLELNGANPPRTLFLKKQWIANSAQFRGRIFRGTVFGITRVRREFENLQRLREWGLNAPAPVAYSEERRFAWLMRSSLLTEGVPNPMGLDLFIRDILPAFPPEERRRHRRELIHRLAEVTRRLHDHQFCHRDFFWRNIVLADARLDRLYVLDMPRGFVWREPLTGRAFDLAALDAPAIAYFRRTDRLRFFLAYIGHARLTADDKRLIRLTLDLAGPARKRQLRHVRSAEMANVKNA
jgi:tRNA A-37 threonylcarbamoyl transferase component Bud32